MKYFLPVFILLGTTAIANADSNTNQDTLEPTLENLLYSLEKLLKFFLKRYDKLNVDGLFGVRCVQGELQRALDKGASGIYPDIQKNIILQNRIKDVLKIADETANLAFSVVKNMDPEYFENFLPVISKPWLMYEVEPQLISKAIRSELPWTKFDVSADREPDKFDEKESDKCMSTLLGKNGYEKCDVDVCLEKMTKLDTKMYYTTHQILWFQLGISAGCLTKFQEKLVDVGGLEKILQKLCTSVVFQMEALSKNGHVHDMFQDIFLEQGMICGAIGFIDAVNRTWLEGVMKWQNKKLGCFREIDIHPDFDYGLIEDLLYANKQEWQNRKLLTDVEMGDKCSAHKSAVAAGFYAVYLKLFLDPVYIRHKLWPDLYGKDYKWKVIWRRRLLYFTFGFMVAVTILYCVGRRTRHKLLAKLGL